MSYETISGGALDAWATEAPPVGQDKLDRVRAKAAEMRDVVHEIDDLEQRLKEAKARLERIKTREMPDVFAEAQTDLIGLTADGNLPACTVKLVPFYSASIKEDNRRAAHDWLRRNSHEGLIKNEFKVLFDRGTDTTAARFASYCLDMGYAYERKEAVHPQTLTAFVRSEVEAGRPVPLDLLGAHVGTTTKLTVSKK